MINIIGAGPVGCYTGYLLSKAGYKVNIFEEHKVIGKPIACTGLLTKQIKKYRVDAKDSVVNEFQNLVINTKKSKLKIKNNDLLIDRYKFDNTIKNMATSEGANIITDHKFFGFNKNKIIFTNDKKIKRDTLIGADGPRSCVAKLSNLWNNRQFYTGIQADFKGKYDDTKYEMSFDSKLMNDFFWWNVPINKQTSRIGLASKLNVKNKFNIIKNNKKITNVVGGLIPIYKPFNKCQNKKENIFLVGDAGSLIKNTTGGGILPGFESATKLCDSICNDKNYDRSLFNLHLELIGNAIMRRMLNNFNDKDYTKLLNYTKQNKIKKVLESVDREKTKEIMIKLLIKEPRYLSYITKLI